MHQNKNIDHLIKMLARLPGLGQKSAKRAILHLFQHKETELYPLLNHMKETADKMKNCDICGNLDMVQPCSVCASHKRNQSLICVVETVSDLWAMERTGSYDGVYHILGATLSALNGITPDDLRIKELIERVQKQEVEEVIIALKATVDGQTTAHYLNDKLEPFNVKLTRLAHGMPIGGELDYMDDGTITLALKSRRSL